MDGVTCACLAAVSLLNLKVYGSKKYRETNRISALVCFTAFLFYLAIIACPTKQRLLRNVDWLVTCPLLLLEMQSLMGGVRLSGWGMLAVAASMAMIVAGMSNHQLSNGRILVGFFFLAVVAFALYRYRRDSKSSRRNDMLVALFFSTWVLYGCVPIFNVNADFTFACLDILSKAVFGVSVALTFQ